MITFFLITGLVLSLGLNIAVFILFKIQLSKINTYESWVIDFKTDLMNTLEKMRGIDQDATFKSSFTSTDKGTFESDDQVGQIFKELLDLIEKLNQRTQ
jgi:hypothetical protein